MVPAWVTRASRWVGTAGVGTAGVGTAGVGTAGVGRVPPVVVSGELSEVQPRLVRRWFPELEVVADGSWGLTDAVVLHARSGDRDLVVKAAGPANHHIRREIHAHRAWVGALAEQLRAPRLLQADESATMTDPLPDPASK